MPGILYFHGRMSGPTGTKSVWLAEQYGAVTPQLDTATTVANALPVARAALAELQPDLVVGSSFGGAVTVALAREGLVNVPMVLIAQAAIKLGGGDALPEGSRAVLIHGDQDTMISHADSVALAATGGPGVRLVTVVGGDHQLHGILQTGELAEALASFGFHPRVG